MTTATQPTEMIARVKALRPEIESFSEESERIRRLPDGLVRLFRENELFGMSRPVEYGGLGLDLVTTMRTVEEIAYADASAGWCATIGSGLIGTAGLSDETKRKMLKRGTSVAGVGAPSGRAVPVEGGYRVTGRWSYASGCQHSDWIFTGNLVFEGDKPRPGPTGAPEFRLALFPAADIEVIDTWHVSGLRGTGSHDVAANDVFVPEAHTSVVRLDGAGGPSAESRIPMFSLLGIGLVPVALGAARRAIDEVVALALDKTPMFAASKLREKAVAHHEIARAQGMLSAGSAYLYQTVAALVERAERGEEIDLRMRAEVRLAGTQATDLASQAVEIAYRLGGGTSNFEKSVLQRCFRDVNAVTQHFAVAMTNYEAVGRVLMGLDPGTPIF